MTLYAVLFYLLAAVILVSTGLAITRRNLVHAVVYLVISFFGSAMIFYMFGAPILAALEIIVYAGAIMILFLFIVMMLRMEGMEEKLFHLRQWAPAMGLSVVAVSVCVMLVVTADPASREPLRTAVADPVVFGHFLFRQHWLAIEIASMLLLVALVGALHLGMARKKSRSEENRP